MPSVKHCSKCKAPFECRNDGTGCWCQNYTLGLDTLKDLKASYEDCLCPQCLAKYSIDATGQHDNSEIR